ncbi:hypothetical protein EHO59_08625 [Leptospira semungkisensis]|uniref:Uncharacterized protein n=1 Tax=Leptospira semungkisensis TaxID=2484985 RepID=A0A4R9G1M0_9LEPT|nr:hypothetical protein [Leptospira semungkisensis]TGK04905.1 hypothetical protein EHO59_08625 [Leptospira semungkisensis]
MKKIFFTDPKTEFRPSAASSYKSKFVLLLLSFYISFSLYSQPLSESETSWIKEGEILIETKQFLEAEKLANSILGSNPSDLKAEFLLTRAWIGLGKEEGKKGNLSSAKEYLEKAYEKWPLNEDLRKEIQELEKGPGHSKTIKNPSTTKRQTFSAAPFEEWKSVMESLRTEISGLRMEVSDLKTKIEAAQTRGNNILLWISALLLTQIVFQILILFKKDK